MQKGGLFKPGYKFGPYTIENYLGSGGFKSVYRALNKGGSAPDPVVALGFPHQQDPDGISELTKEFHLASRLNHPNILRTYSIEEHEGITFLVMEYLEGKSLRKILQERDHFETQEAVRYIGMISEGLSYAHSMRIFHRDVKPENIFITADGTPKLLDFGVARLLARTSEKGNTRIGTVEYMAPETLQGASGTNADLWALGIIFYELLTGHRPFTGEVGEVIAKIMSKRPEEGPLRETGADNRIVRVLRKLLDKNPKERYQTAEELARDLLVISRRTRMVDDDESRLEVLIRASFPLVYVLSYEEERIIAAVRGIAKQLSEDRGQKRAFYIWSASQGLRNEEGKLIESDSIEDPTSALVHTIENPEDAIYLFLDMHHHFTPVTTRLIRDAARAVRKTRKSVLFLSPSYQVPEELSKEVNLIAFQLPDRQHLEPLLEKIAGDFRENGFKVELSEEDKDKIFRAAAGMTLQEAERAIRGAGHNLCGLVTGVERMIIEEKTQVIRKTGILEYYPRSESFSDVGGLSNLLDWFNKRLPVFSGVSRYAGLPVPKGVLLIGIPGCGKSLTAKALAGAWGVPLLRLDVGRIFGSIVGTSENNLRRAIQTAEAVSPGILWIDEVEKGFAGVRGQGGGGVAARVFGNFLSWLQDKRSPVFVVATANDLSGIPPEFLRQGRFDEIFFVGLPAEKERDAIFRIHLAKRGRNPEIFDIESLVKNSNGFSGAEIEQAVITGLFNAFEAGRELETDDVVQALTSTFPLSQSRSAEVYDLMQWAQRNAKMAG